MQAFINNVIAIGLTVLGFCTLCLVPWLIHAIRLKRKLKRQLSGKEGKVVIEDYEEEGDWKVFH